MRHHRVVRVLDVRKKSRNAGRKKRLEILVAGRNVPIFLAWKHGLILGDPLAS